MNILVFEDLGASQLAPITLSRPAYAISCGGFRLIDWLDEKATCLSASVRPHLQTLQINDHPHFASPSSDKPTTMLVNARTVPSPNNFARLDTLIRDKSADGNVLVLRNAAAVIAAIVPTKRLDKINLSIDSSLNHAMEFSSELDKLYGEQADRPEVVVEETDLELFEFPHDVIDQHMNGCRPALELRLNSKVGHYEEIADNVFVAKNGEVKIPDSTVFDTSEGPIVFESGVKVGPFCFFRGPVHVGMNSKISEHSSIKDGVAIGHTCKIGGEVEGVVVEPYSNKQHFGFLGHSYLGSWINLGAGTCNSDLKNTYGKVNMTYGDRKVSTGMQFVGCVMGDYAKTAINTSIFTGKLIGVGSMLYGFATANVPSFVNYARSLDQIGVLPAEVVITTQKRMFGRRNVDQRPCDIQLIHDMFALTSCDRSSDWSSEPLAF